MRARADIFQHRWRPRSQCGPAPLQRQLAETPHRRHLIANSHTTETKSGNCGNRAFIIALLFGRRTDDRTRPSLERFSTQQTLPAVGMGSRCRRNHFIAGGSMKSKLPSCDGEHPWHAQFCRILRREQSGSSLVSLDGGPGDHNHADSETDTAIPDDDILSR